MKIQLSGWQHGAHATTIATVPAVLLGDLLRWGLGEPDSLCCTLTFTFRTPNLEKKRKKKGPTVTDRVSVALTSAGQGIKECNYQGRKCWRLKNVCGMSKDLAIIKRELAIG